MLDIIKKTLMALPEKVFEKKILIQKQLSHVYETDLSNLHSKMTCSQMTCSPQSYTAHLKCLNIEHIHMAVSGMSDWYTVVSGTQVLH